VVVAVAVLLILMIVVQAGEEAGAAVVAELVGVVIVVVIVVPVGMGDSLRDESTGNQHLNSQLPVLHRKPHPSRTSIRPQLTMAPW